jgi:transmembrane sensor
MSEQDNKQDSNCCEDYQDVSTSQEERLQYECEQAFLRLQFEEPSGAEEWKKFSSRVRQEKKKSRKLQSFILFSASAAALLIAVFLLWSNVETTLHEKQVAVLVKTEPAKQASVIEEDISSEQKIETPLPNISKARIEKEGVVLSATEANYTRASVERVCRNIVSIPRGQVYKIVLSDGTVDDSMGQGSFTQFIQSFLKFVVRSVIKETERTSTGSSIINNFGHH